MREVDLTVAGGEVVALAGENGSGKTTTLRLLAGLLAPDAGDALLGGRPAVEVEARQGLGYADERDRFAPGLDVLGALGYAAGLSGAAGAAARREALAVAESLALGPWLGTPLVRCSHGIRRRVSLGEALVGRPTALILDEPLSGLDPVARARSLASIRRAADSGAAVLVTLHDAPAIEALADRLILLGDGEVVDEGSPRELRAAAPEAGARSADPDRPTDSDWLAAALLRRPGPGQSPP